MFDVFFSYRHADATNARQVVQALRAAGLRVWFDESHIEAFSSIQRGIEDGLAQSKVLLAWYSTTYPESLACQWELTHAFTSAQHEGDPRRRVLLVNPHTTNSHIQPVELRDALYAASPQDADAVETLTQNIAGHVAKLSGTLGDIVQRIRPQWYGPINGNGSNRFFGRLREMWEIHFGLQRADMPIIANSHERPLVRLVGVGGSGKSLTAEMYALRFGAAYPGGIYWLRAMGHDAVHATTPEEHEALRDSQIIDFALAHGIQTTDCTPVQIHTALGLKLQTGEPYLWVVDDLPTGLAWQKVQPWLAPSTNGHTLITTRSEADNWAGSQVTVGALDETSAFQLLTHSHQPNSNTEHDAARQLVADLGGHALALELAAVATRTRGYVAFQKEVNSPTRDALDFAAELMAARGQTLPHRDKANLNLSQTLLTSVDALTPDAKDVLRLAAQLAPAPLSRLLVAQTLSTADKLDTIKAQDVADIAMSAVAAHSLARETSPGHLLVHTLVSRTMRFRDKDVGRLGMLYTCALPAVERLLGNDIFEARLHGNIGDLIAHARAVLAPAMADPVHATLAQARLLDAVYIYDAQHGNYASALLSANALVSYSRATAGPEHRVTLGFMLYRGRMQRLKGDLPDAWETNQRRVEICRRTLGKGHPDTLTALSDLALVLAQQGQLAQARELQEQVLAMRIHILGTEHEDTLTAANNLATTMATSGDFANARPLQEGVVAGRRKLLGPEHVETLAAISNLAVTLRALKDTAGAENLEHSLKASSSENLPENLLFLHNRAAALHGEGKLAEARELMERVLQLRRNQLGAKHPETLLTMNNLGSIMITQGDFAAARSLLQEGLQLSREVLGPNHIQTWQAAGRLFLASVHEGQGWEQVKASMLHDLAPLMAQDPATLSDELREHRNMALALRKIAGAEHPRSKP